jgi:hypothetical protein
MLHLMGSLRILLAAAALASTVAISGCAGTSVGVRYRVYDPYRSDYHVWDRDEGVYYNQWTIQTHRDPHRDFGGSSLRSERTIGNGGTTMIIDRQT